MNNSIDLKNIIDWEGVSKNQKLSEELIRENSDKVNWLWISACQNLSEVFIREMAAKDLVNWCYISVYQKLSEDFIREFQNKVNWSWISNCQKLSEDFIREFQDKVDWKNISAYQKLSEDFIREFQDKVAWEDISEYQKLSEEFIREFKNNVNWFYISIYQKLSKDFMKEFNLEKPDNNWLYTSKEEKLEYIKNHTDYEVVNDKYIIAYKSCRSNGYSKFNFQYRYEVGKTYESHCDCNLREEGSFGLSAWTKEGALEYCKEKLFRVKINIEDIGAIVHKNNKIRCFRLTILEEVKI